MTARPRRRLPASAAVAALLVGGCGPYPDLAQKLDVTSQIVGGETWIAAQGLDRSEVRLLVLGPLPPGGGSSGFAFSALQMPISAGTSATTLQGTWTEAGGIATFTARHAYLLPDERSTGLWSRTGVTRGDVNLTSALAVTRSPGRLVLAGDPALAATYVPLREALAALGTATERDAACAFQVANLGIRTSEVRILGFGGPTMTQYKSAATFVGTLAGTFRVRVSIGASLASTTTIGYFGLEDLGGIRVDGPQITDANAGGDGHMSGTLAFALEPLAATGTAGAPIAGTIDFGDADPADWVQIRNGDPVGGHYLVTLEGGGTARVSPATAPSPSVAECLALP